jgi:phytoene dehydrogenase-like protein
MQAWVLTASLHGSFHADIHAGNLHLLHDGQLAMLDWGIVARMDPQSYVMLEILLEAAIGVDGAWDRMAEQVKTTRPHLQETLALTDEQIRRMVRGMMEPVLTQPVGEVRMSALFGSTDDMLALASDEEAPPKRSLREQWRALRSRARTNQYAIKHGHLDVDSQRTTFLAGKQLVYLEHYWKMYLPEEPLLGDHDFVRAVLAERRRIREQLD